MFGTPAQVGQLLAGLPVLEHVWLTGCELVTTGLRGFAGGGRALRSFCFAGTPDAVCLCA